MPYSEVNPELGFSSIVLFGVLTKYIVGIGHSYDILINILGADFAQHKGEYEQ